MCNHPILVKKVICLLVVIASLSSQSGAQGFSSQTQSRLQHVIDSFQSNPANPYVGGMSAAIKVDGLAFWEGSTGFAARNVDGNNNLLPGGTPFLTSTLSRMYSVTKSFTAPLVLELANEKVFSLDDPVSKFLPLNLINAGLNSHVTIRQLLAHESGYSNYTDEFMLQIAVAFQPTHVWTVFEMLTFVHQINNPGAVRLYSSTNYLVLGAIIEIATGKSVEQHFRERFFTPLNLNSTYLAVRESQPSGTTLAAPHENLSPFNPVFQLTGQPVYPDAYTNVSGFPFTGIVSLAFTGGGLVTNIADLAEWGNSLFGGSATSQSTLDAMLNSISATSDPDGDFLGYGIFRTTKISANDIFIGHDGSAPGYRSVMFYQPDRKMTIAILTNYGGAKLYAVAKALFEALPEFTCGNKNKKESKIIVCFNGNNICIDRNAAPAFIAKGAYLGNCQAEPVSANSGKQVSSVEIANLSKNNLLAYPNPFAGNIRLSFTPDISGQYDLSIYDINGKLVRSLYKKIAEKGNVQHVEWNGSNMSSGTYIVCLRTPAGIERQKIVLNK
ncbi:MAG: T9SS type A sorting domain-containing protein [Bacteroidetes bacterium]|nr:MAG: T9SS type A sorting domain-containing protein [Bacteroidota bacterium]